MQSSRPAASTNLSIICFSRAVRPAELKGMRTNLNFATRSAKSGTTYGFADGAEFAVVAGADWGAGAECWFAASGYSVATAIAPPAASGSNERNLRA